MPRFTGKSNTPRLATASRNGSRAAAAALPDHGTEEVGHSLIAPRGSRARGRRSQPLRFFPHHFAVPNTLYGMLAVIAGTLVLGALAYVVRDILSPVLLAVLAGILLWPFRSEPRIRPLLVASALLLVLWIVANSFSVLIPFIVAFLLAYIVDPLVTKLQRRFYIKRWIMALVASIMLMALMVIVTGYMVPILLNQLGAALGSLERFAEGFAEWARSGGLTRLTGIPQEKAQLIVERYLIPRISGLEAMVFSQADNATGAIPSAISGIVSTISNVLMVPFLMFYLVKDYWHIRATIYSFIPQVYQVRSQRMLNDMHEVVGGFLRGDLITSAFQGAFVGIGLAIIGIPGALLLGVLTGVLTLIPYIGGIIAYVIVLFASLSMPDPAMAALWVTVLFASQSIIETAIIGPHIMGRRTDLHPLVVMSSLVLFGYFMGVPGMLIAIPVTGLLLRAAYRWREKRLAELEREKVDADLKQNPHHAKRGEQLDLTVDATAGPKAPLP